MLEYYRTIVLIIYKIQKVNQKNSWNLKLIEYIDDVLDRQEKDTAEVLGTNFQVASCTLDASVKIYSYRVDSVHSEAYKMLGGLARTEGGEEEEENAAKAGDEGGDEEDKAFEGEKKDEKETAKRVSRSVFFRGCVCKLIIHRLSRDFLFITYMAYISYYNIPFCLQ